MEKDEHKEFISLFSILQIINTKKDFNGIEQKSLVCVNDKEKIFIKNLIFVQIILK